MDFFEQGQFGKALENIQKAIEKSPNNVEFLSTKGVFLHKTNDLNKAIEAYQKAVSISPNHSFSHYNLGLIYMKLGRTPEAIREWEAVLKFSPEDTDATFNIAVTLALQGKLKEAIILYEKILTINPKHVQAHQNLGILYRDEKEFGKAINHLNQLRELDLTYSEVVVREIRFCQEQEFLANAMKSDASKVAQEIEISSKKDSGQVEDILLNALKANLTGDFHQALVLSEEVLKIDSNNLQGRLIRGQALKELEEIDEAIAEFSGIQAEFPTSPEAPFHLGLIFFEMDDLENALIHFKKAHKLDPRYPMVNENIQNIQVILKEGKPKG
ncbi:tetratricopeptide repeat protein [bacterium]|nr:tetratricopeptide repeat protein [bacterium]